MTGWLIDTALLNRLEMPRSTSLRHWLDANDASVFLSSASLTELAAGISKTSTNQAQRAHALRAWLDGLISRYADRIHGVDTEIAMRAGALLPSLQIGLPRRRFHDAVLVATAQLRGHGLLTRRDGIFGPWTNVPIVTI